MEEVDSPAHKKRRSNRLSQKLSNNNNTNTATVMQPPSILPSLVPLSSITTNKIPFITLRHTATDNLQIPQLGFGTYRLRRNDVIAPVTEALGAGYKLIDTAQVYNNEKEIGSTLCKLPDSSDLFITTKLWRSNQGTNAIVKKNLQQSLKKLQRKQLDLWLLHWPGPGQHMFKKTQVPSNWTPAMRLDTWRAMVECQKEGLVKAVGVSNFSKRHLQELKDKTGLQPAVNQVELHPFLVQADLVDYCNKEGIALMAYCSLGEAKKEFLENEVVVHLVKKHNKTSAQVLLRWAIQKNFIVIPCSTSKNHILENKSIWDFALDAQDMKDLDGLNKNMRIAWKKVDPDTVP